MPETVQVSEQKNRPAAVLGFLIVCVRNMQLNRQLQLLSLWYNKFISQSTKYPTQLIYTSVINASCYNNSKVSVT